MACDSPITIRFKTPRYNEAGDRIYNFPADCGKCLKCLMKRKAQWAYRMFEEKKKSFSSAFITLTYADEYLPHGDEGPSANKADHFEFIKRLKKLESNKSLKKRYEISSEEMERMRCKEGEFSPKYSPGETRFKYYGITEYGDRYSRPHLHYIVFNVRDFRNISLAWPYGISQVDECNQNTIDYVLKYMVKNHENKDYEKREKEVSFMSKGIGLKDDDKSFIKYIKRADGNSIVNSRGHKVAVPRYYRKKYLSESENSKKVQYISSEVEKKDKEFEARAIREGFNPDLHIKQGKDIRNHLLKDRKLRDIK